MFEVFIFYNSAPQLKETEGLRFSFRYFNQHTPYDIETPNLE